MAKKEIEIKTWLTRQEMVKYLEDLAACLAQGRVVLQRGGDFLEFCPAQSLELEMEGVHKKGQQKISIEISWRQVVMEPSEEPLRISADSPPPPAQAEPSAPEAQEPSEVPAEQAAATPSADQTPPQEIKEETGKAKAHRQPAK